MVRCWNIWLIDFPTFDTGGRPLCEKYTFKLYLNKKGVSINYVSRRWGRGSQLYSMLIHAVNLLTKGGGGTKIDKILLT